MLTTLVVFLLAFGANQAPARAMTGPSAAGKNAQLQALQALLDSYVAAGKAAGIVAAIGQDDAPPTFVSAGRLSDDPAAPAAGPDSLWRIYSMTKPITAAAAMILVQEGKLKLDQPISDFIPAFKTMRVLDAPATSLASHPATHPITIRHLLTHTSGLGYQIIGTGPLPREYQRLGLLGGRADAEASKAQPKTLEAFANRVATVPLLAEPGTEWNYSISLDVLGRVIEVASGVPFDRFVDTRLLKPLGMNSTYWTVPRADVGRMSTLYFWQGDHRVPLETGAGTDWLHPPLVPYGGAGLVSSARDYDRFLRMLAEGGSLDGVRVLKPETVKLALSNLLPPGVHVVNNVTPAPLVAEGFGAGGSLYLNDVPDGVGAGTFGWFGAAGTVAFIDPKNKTRVTVMVNYFPARKWPLYSDVIKSIYSK
ncbi:serine hydrolase domain-containing protein [Sphingomonas crusticola]|uniref:serine hydrolase domain-containing protein n=1 Tax=Sphingomonas crusticola TaxID=1697973 RepID=UPI000E23407B